MDVSTVALDLLQCHQGSAVEVHVICVCLAFGIQGKEKCDGPGLCLVHNRHGVIVICIFRSGGGIRLDRFRVGFRIICFAGRIRFSDIRFRLLFDRNLQLHSSLDFPLLLYIVECKDLFRGNAIFLCDFVKVLIPFYLVGQVILRFLILRIFLSDRNVTLLFLCRIQGADRDVEQLACLKTIADYGVMPLEFVRGNVVCLADRVDGFSLFDIVHIHLLSLDAHYLV